LFFFEDGLEVWEKPLSDGAWAVTFVNRTIANKKINFDWNKNPIKDAVLDMKRISTRQSSKSKNFGKTKKLEQQRRILRVI
jgi:alpha-galactosidase